MMHGADLLRWTRGVYMAWWETRHDSPREPADEMLARVYLQGGIDALRDEVQRKIAERKP